MSNLQTRSPYRHEMLSSRINKTEWKNNRRMIIKYGIQSKLGKEQDVCSKENSTKKEE